MSVVMPFFEGPSISPEVRALIRWRASLLGEPIGERQKRELISVVQYELHRGPPAGMPSEHQPALEVFQGLSEASRFLAVRTGLGFSEPLTFREAADALADAVRGGLFGPTRDIERRVREAGHSDAREWIEAALEDYDRLSSV